MIAQPNFKIIDQSVEGWFEFTTDIDEQLKQCQYMTRISYRSEDNEAKVTAIDFVQSLINGRHYEPLEFVSIYADLEDNTFASLRGYMYDKAADRHNAHVRNIHKTLFAFTLREVVEWFREYVMVDEIEHFDLKSPFFQKLCRAIVPTQEVVELLETLPMEERCKYIRLKFVVTTNRQIGTEITRHRALSKNWESTRHCIYNNKRFGVLNICNPEIYRQIISGQLSAENADIVNYLKTTADLYMKTAETNKVQAAYLLPSDIAVKIAFAGYVDDIQQVIKVRTTNWCGNPHVDANALMTSVSAGLFPTYNKIWNDYETKNTPDNDDHARIHHILSLLGDNVSKEEKQRIIDALDINQDGQCDCSGPGNCQCGCHKAEEQQEQQEQSQEEKPNGLFGSPSAEELAKMSPEEINELTLKRAKEMAHKIYEDARKGNPFARMLCAIAAMN